MTDSSPDGNVFGTTLERAGLMASTGSTHAGSFDGVKTHIHAGHLHQTVVSIHEHVHERICIGTPDGRVLFFISGLALSDILPKQQSAICRSNRTALFEASRRAHEVFTTYLSTNSLKATEIDETLSLYDEVYLKYYSALASVLDWKASSTYLRYVVAWAMCSVVFSSRLISRLGSDGIFTDLHLRPMEKPNERLIALLDRMTPDDLTNIVASSQTAWDEECASREMATWDLSDEDEWHENHERASHAEKIAIEHAYLLFSTMLPEGVVSDVEFTNWTTAFLERFYPYVDALDLAVPEDGAAAIFVNSGDDYLGWFQAGGRIDNRGRSTCFVREHEALPDKGDLIAIRPTWDRRTDGWAVFFQAADPSISDYALISDGDLAQALFTEEEQSRGQGESERVLVLIDSFPTVDDLVDFATRYHREGDCAERSKTIGYVHGNWLQAATALLDSGYSIRVGLNPTFEYEPTHGTEMPATMGMMINVMAVDGVPIWFVKAMNPVAANGIGRMFKRLEPHDNLRWFGPDQQNVPLQLLGVGMGVLLSAWDRL